MRSLLPILLLIFLTLLPIAGWADDALSAGMTTVSRGEYDAAVLALYPLAQERPYDATCQYWLGRAYYGQQFYRLASDHLGEAVDRDARNRDACLWYARALRGDGRLEDALAVLSVFMKRFPNDKLIVTEYAVSVTLAGNIMQGITALNALIARNPSPALRQYVEECKRGLADYIPLASVEPKIVRKGKFFELRYNMPEGMVSPLVDALEATRAEISTAFGVEMKGFRVMAFATRKPYNAYIRALRGGDGEPAALAYTLGDSLTLRLPEKWPDDAQAGEELASLLRHEMAHLAINLRTGGQGVPRWLHEALACHYGGTAGFATGHIAEKPLSLRELDTALIAPEVSRQEQAYAQAHAMAAVLVKGLGQEKLLKLLDRLAVGEPLPTAYQEISGETLDAFLADWPRRYAALT